jgi:hypothetical protein
VSFAVRTLGGSTAFGALISDQSAENLSLSGIGGTASADYRLASTGVASATNSAGVLTAISGEWLLSGAASLYEAQAVWQAGTGVTGGPTGWVSLSSTRDWTLSGTNRYVTRPLFVSIRLASTGAVITSATINFEVDSAP